MKVSRTELERLVLKEMRKVGIDTGGIDESELVRDGIEALVYTILKALASGKEVRLNDFGRLRVSRRERDNHNPLTGERLGTSIENYVIFTPSKKMVNIHES